MLLTCSTNLLEQRLETLTILVCFVHRLCRDRACMGVGEQIAEDSSTTESHEPLYIPEPYLSDPLRFLIQLYSRGLEGDIKFGKKRCFHLGGSKGESAANLTDESVEGGQGPKDCTP